jgi:molecular chaperone HtpG
MLAVVPLPSIFGLGGVINSSVVRPTAGREAVTDESRTFAQVVLAAGEMALAEFIAASEGLPERFLPFFRYISSTGRLDLAANATIRTFGHPQRVPLGSLRSHGAGLLFFTRDSHDQAILQAYAEQGKTVALLSTDPHRQKVEQRYLLGLCSAAPLEDRVTCLRVLDELPFPQAALRYQVQDRLRSQFLIDSISVQPGELSHGAMLWAPAAEANSGRRVLFVDFRHNQLRRLVELRESFGFDPVLDVFIRDSVLPHLETSFPELKKRDFDALLRKLQSSVEYFEIDPSDISRLRQLAEITNMSPEEVAAVFGGSRSRAPRPTSVGRKDIGSVTQQVNQVVQSAPNRPVEEIRQDLAMRLLTTDLDAKILDATEADARLGLARYYVALAPDAHVLYRRVFLERRPAMDFSWGGHRAGYLFYSAGSSVIYYDIQFDRLVDAATSDRAGSLTIEGDPLVLRNNVFVPVPPNFETYLVPLQDTLKFTIRHQILGVRSYTAI